MTDISAQLRELEREMQRADDKLKERGRDLEHLEADKTRLNDKFEGVKREHDRELTQLENKETQLRQEITHLTTERTAAHAKHTQLSQQERAA